jgi:hypothetical protein
MKRNLSIILAIAIALMLSVPAYAADQIVNTEITSVTLKQDKHQNDFVRMVIPLEQNINGISYTDGVTVNAYDTHVATAKTLKAGDTLNAIVKFKEYKGSTYGTVLKFLPKE